MYEVRNNLNEVLSSDMVLDAAKARAEAFDKLDKSFLAAAPNRKNDGPFSVFEVKQIWSTQTLEDLK